MIDNSKNIEVRPNNIYLVKENNVQRIYFNLIDSHTFKHIDLVVDEFPVDHSPDYSPVSPAYTPFSPDEAVPVWNIDAHIVGITLKKSFYKECHIHNPKDGTFYIEWYEEDLIDSGNYRIEFTLTNYFEGSPHPHVTLFKVVDLKIRERLEELEEIPVEEFPEDSVYTPLYTEIIDYVKTMLGDEIIPVELTDKQIEKCIEEALDKYAYLRNRDDSIYFIDRYSEENNGVVNGFVLPMEIKKTVFEVIMEPTSPFSSVAQGVGLSFTNDYYFDWLFAGYFAEQGNGHYQDRFYLSDYYIYSQSDKDRRQVLGTHITWEILNGKLYIFPVPSTNMKIAVRYKNLPDIDEAQNEMWVKKYSLARSMILLGIIRSTFKMGIPIGAENTTLNGEDLISMGERMMEKLEEDLRNKQEPIFLDLI